MKKILLLFICLCLVAIIFLLLQIISLVPIPTKDVGCNDVLKHYTDREIFESETGCSYIQTRINSLRKENPFTK